MCLILFQKVNCLWWTVRLAYRVQLVQARGQRFQRRKAIDGFFSRCRRYWSPFLVLFPSLRVIHFYRDLIVFISGRNGRVGSNLLRVEVNPSRGAEVNQVPGRFEALDEVPISIFGWFPFLMSAIFFQKSYRLYFLKLWAHRVQSVSPLGRSNSCLQKCWAVSSSYRRSLFPFFQNIPFDMNSIFFQKSDCLRFRKEWAYRVQLVEARGQLKSRSPQ